MSRFHDRATQALAAGRPDEAMRLAVEGVRQDPDDFSLYLLLAHVLRQQGRLPLAIEAAERAVAVAPDRMEPPIVLAELLDTAGKGPDATRTLQEAATRQPQSVELLICLGNSWQARNDPAQAATCFARAARLRPGMVELHYNLGNALRQAGQRAAAEAAFVTALQVNPRFAPAHHNLADLYGETNRYRAAEDAYRAAIAAAPDLVEPHIDLGALLSRQGRFEDALAAQSEAVELFPRHADAHMNLAITRLIRGDFTGGFAAYEWRWGTQGFSPRDFTQPRWRGEALDGRTLLVHAEQGLGDTLQFLRFIALAAARGGPVVVEVYGQVLRLCDDLAGAARIVRAGDPLPDFDTHCPLMSLPHVLGITPDTLPARVPYLSVPEEARTAWRTRLAEHRGLKVGLVWAGRPEHKRDAERSLFLEQLRPLAGVAGVTFVSLQAEPAAAAAGRHPDAPLRLVHLGPPTDMADTAAIVEGLDLVIAVDTSVAHLAGALGKPVWTLLTFVPDWRWMIGWDTSPWYPTMRLFRQKRAGDWAPVIERLARTLTAWAKKRATGRLT